MSNWSIVFGIVGALGSLCLVGFYVLWASDRRDERTRTAVRQWGGTGSEWADAGLQREYTNRARRNSPPSGE